MVRRKKLAAVIALITALVFCMETVCVSAASLSQIRKEITQKEKELDSNQKKHSDLTSQLKSLESQINTKQNDISKLENAISEAEDQLEVLEKELAEAEEKVNTQNENLNARLRAMYKNGSVGFVDVLLDSGSFSEFLTNLSLVEKIYASDKDVLEELQAVYDEIDAKKKEVETMKNELAESKTLAEQEKASLETAKSEVEKKKAEIASDINATEDMLDELEAEAASMTTQIKNEGSSSSNSTYTGGIMCWPAPSYTRVSSKFGYRKHPVTGKRKFHSGVDLAAPGGSPILAANSGKVIRSYYGSGYGNCIWVDHGGGIVTVYAHCSSRLVSVGQKVSRGQQIGKVGSTGLSTGNHLHFEVRKNGSPVNPMPYIT